MEEARQSLQSEAHEQLATKQGNVEWRVRCPAGMGRGWERREGRRKTRGEETRGSEKRAGEDNVERGRRESG